VSATANRERDGAQPIGQSRLGRCRTVSLQPPRGKTELNHLCDVTVGVESVHGGVGHMPRFDSRLSDQIQRDVDQSVTGFPVESSQYPKCMQRHGPFYTP